MNPFEPPQERVLSEMTSLPAPASPELGSTILVEKKAGSPDVTWSAAFNRDRIWLTPSDGRPVISLSPQEFVEHVQLLLGTFMKAMVIKRQKPSLVLRLAKDSIQLVREWIDPVVDEHMKRAIKARLRFSIPIGIFIVFVNLSLPSGQSTLLGLIFGAGLVVVSVAGMVRRHALLFLADAALWLVAFLNNAILAYETSSTFSWVFSAFCVIFANSSITMWRFYRTQP